MNSNDPDLILHSGRITTLDSKYSEATNVAIKNARSFRASQSTADPVSIRRFMNQVALTNCRLALERPTSQLDRPTRSEAGPFEYSEVLNREVTYADIRPDDWVQQLKQAGLPEHLTKHLVTMAELNRAGRYDRLADGVERLTGRSPVSVRQFVSLHADKFGGRGSLNKTANAKV